MSELSQGDWDKLIQTTAMKYNLDPKLVWAICKQESNFSNLAVRYEAGWAYQTLVANYAYKCRISYDTEKIMQSMSWGPMQIMGSVARELGYDKPLQCLVDDGLELSCQKLAKICNEYQEVENQIASYNGGSPRKYPTGKYFNQAYVDSVMNFMRSAPY